MHFVLAGAVDRRLSDDEGQQILLVMPARQLEASACK